MAFALTLFVEAANRRVSSLVTPPDVLPQERDDVCGLIYQTLCADVDRPPKRGDQAPNRQTTLYSAFSTLCDQYDGDPLQVAVCARVLAFYFLMERSAGAVLADWVKSHPDTPEYVSLDPAIVEAMATVRLRGSVQLSPSSFLELVAEKAANPNRAEEW